MPDLPSCFPPCFRFLHYSVYPVPDDRVHHHIENRGGQRVALRHASLVLVVLRALRIVLSFKTQFIAFRIIILLIFSETHMNEIEKKISCVYILQYCLSLEGHIYPVNYLVTSICVSISDISIYTYICTCYFLDYFTFQHYHYHSYYPFQS